MNQLPARKLSSLVRLLLFTGYPLASILIFYTFGSGVFHVLDLIFLFGISMVLAFVTASFLRSPSQFIVAFIERIRYVYGLIFSLFIRVVNLIRRIIYISARSLYWVIFLIIYWVSPIDLIPDPLLPFGILDDAGVSYWVYIKVANVAANIELKRTARDILENTKIRTPFP